MCQDASCRLLREDAAETKNTIAVPSAPPDGAPSSRRRQPIETGKPGKPEEPIFQLGPQPEPEVGVPTLPGQVGLVHVDEKKLEEHP
eukprot:COSAG03_NODE_21267_length_306_cov_1.251208_1_plen_86_part_10